nr:hypothetical protein GCM10020093_109130 [Planobispora longispora]
MPGGSRRLDPLLAGFGGLPAGARILGQAHPLDREVLLRDEVVVAVELLLVGHRQTAVGVRADVGRVFDGLLVVGDLHMVLDEVGVADRYEPLGEAEQAGLHAQPLGLPGGVEEDVLDFPILSPPAAWSGRLITSGICSCVIIYPSFLHSSVRPPIPPLLSRKTSHIGTYWTFG